MRGSALRAAVLAVCLLLTVLPTVSSAAGVKLRGMALTGTKPVAGSVGNCVCNDTQWYTVGLKAGTATVSGTLLTSKGVPSFSYSIRVFVMLGGQDISGALDACPARKRPCNQGFHITFPVPRAGVYYVKVFGEGADGIQYRLRVQAPLYRLSCARGRC